MELYRRLPLLASLPQQNCLYAMQPTSNPAVREIKTLFPPRERSVLTSLENILLPVLAALVATVPMLGCIVFMIYLCLRFHTKKHASSIGELNAREDTFFATAVRLMEEERKKEIQDGCSSLHGLTRTLCKAGRSIQPLSFPSSSFLRIHRLCPRTSFLQANHSRLEHYEELRRDAASLSTSHRTFSA